MEITQSLENFTAVSPDPAFSRSRVRKYLAAHGMRGAELRAEVDRITSGYIAWDIKQGIDPMHNMMLQKIHYPYGWPKVAMTHLMKRMFYGHSKSVSPIIMDEAWMILGERSGDDMWKPMPLFSTAV